MKRAQIGNEHGKLVAVDPAEQGRVGQVALQALGDQLQQPVAVEVADTVVDIAEGFEADDHQGCLLSVMGGLGGFQESIPAQQSGQAVIEHLLAQGIEGVLQSRRHRGECRGELIGFL